MRCLEDSSAKGEIFFSLGLFALCGVFGFGFWEGWVGKEGADFSHLFVWFGEAGGIGVFLYTQSTVKFPRGRF